MNYRFVWADGQLELGSAHSKIHHINLVQRMLEDGRLNEWPSNVVGGIFLEDIHHGGQFDRVVIEPMHRAGVFPSTDELKFLIHQELGRTSNGQAQIQAYVHELRLAATVEDTEPAKNFGFMKEPHATLYPCAFEGEKMRPEASKAIKNHILKALIDAGFSDADNWIYFTVYGSGASYNWDEEGDFDVQMWVDYIKYNENHSEPMTSDELVVEVRRWVQTANFPSFAELNLSTDDCEGSMLIQYYPKPGTGTEEENLASKPYACYDMEQDQWLQKPEPIRPTFYGEMFLMVMPKAEDIAIQAEALLAELDRNVTNWQFWYGMYNEYHNDEYLKEADRAQESAHQEREAIRNLFENVFKGRQEAYSPAGEGFKDERDIIQKVLEVWGIFQDLKHNARADLPWEETEIETNSKTAAWADIMEKAQRLREEGRIHILRNGYDNVFARVDGDTGTYNTEIWRDYPGSPAITRWNCDCPWGQVSWGRTRQWKKYEGRPCAHTLGLYWTSLSLPVDEEEERMWTEEPVQQIMFDPGQTLPGATQPGGQIQGQQPGVIPAESIPGQQVAPPAGISAPTIESNPTKPGEGGTVNIPGALSKWTEEASR